MAQQLTQEHNDLRIKDVIALFGILFVSGCNAHTAPNASSVIGNSPIITTVEISANASSETGPLRDVEFTVESPRRVAAGTEVAVRVTLTNNGNDDLQFFASTSLPDSVELVDPDGSMASYTDYGKNNLNSRA